MSKVHSVPVEALRGLDLHAGDTLYVLAEEGASFVVSVSHAMAQPSEKGLASGWLESSLGSVRHLERESADDVRMAHYREKHGLDD